MRSRRHHPWVLVLALALWLGSGCGGPPPPPTTDDGSTPAPPTDVTTSAGVGYVAVAWSHDGEGIDGFEVSRTPAATNGAVARASDATVLGTVPAASRAYVDRSVAASGTYLYSVRALDADGAGSTGSAQTTPAVAPEVGTFNPDPQRYLAVRVLDEQGQPMPNASVRFSSTTEPRWYDSRSDDDGVVLLADASLAWEPAGILSGNLLVIPHWSTETARPRIVPFHDVSHPGTLDDDPRTGELFDVTLSVSHADTIEQAFVQLALPGPERSSWTDGFSVSDDGLVAAQVGPGTYPIAISAWGDTVSRFVVTEEPLSVAGPTSRSIDTATIGNTSTLRVDYRGDLDARPTFCPFPTADATLPAELGVAYCGYAETFVLTAAPYRASLRLAVNHEGAWWSFSFDALDDFDLSVAGTTLDVVLGDALSARVDTNDLSYQPGDDVRVLGGVSDANGHRLTAVFASSARSDATVTVTDPFGAVVEWIDDVRLWSLQPGGNVSFVLPPTAPAGTYTVDVTFDTGPLLGIVDVSTSFEVVVP